MNSPKPLEASGQALWMVAMMSRFRAEWPEHCYGQCQSAGAPGR
jgi:hypothetical protein